MPSRPRRQTSESSADLRKRTTTDPSNFPRVLSNYVPTCAQKCLSTYINQQYDCTNGDVSCLCSQYGNSGFTLGELALVCVSISCPSANQQDPEPAKAKAYDICAAQNDAAAATQQTLIPPATSSTSVSSSSIQTTTTATTSTSSEPTSTTRSTDTPSATTTSASSESTPERTAITSGQAIGISVAAVGFVLIAVGIFYALGCIRRRKRKAAERATKHDSYDFIDDASVHGSEFPHGFINHGNPGGLDMSGAVSSSEKRNTNWPTLQAHQQPYYRHEKNSSQDTQTWRSDSPVSYRSASSMRTTSQLLPEKPSGLLLRPPPRSPELDNMRTPATIFEEDRFSAHIAPPVPSLPKNPRQPQYAHQFARPIEHMKQTSLTLDIPNQTTQCQAVQFSEPSLLRAASQSTMAHPPALMPGQSMPTFPPPPAFQHAGPTFPPPPTSAARPIYERPTYGNSSSSVLDYYASPEDDSPTDLYSSTPIEDETQVRKAAPAAIAISKPSFPPLAVRASLASDVSRRTSFESTDPDESTPEEEDKRLTPVKEAASPIAEIRYPKVPRSANQSVPRSPVYQPAYQFPITRDSRSIADRRQERVPHTRDSATRDREHGHTASSSGSSLAAKRRGDSAANKLHITTITPTRAPRTPPRQENVAVYTRETPLRGYGRTASSAGVKTPDWPLKIEMKSPPGGLKSPLWEPKLTPRREGDDLYLSVSVATPQHAQFPRR
ncbi:hypothetical protein TI39_contig612g00008 [Zymoseptoria brevis]|uniref:CFEM domain-containing protein n=1 Tax=Zymoseptoria brevis TaxID=1047168 RepID=A0A0F4GGN3_9PEZI|nr:hypothetical protein TI39_contig612g00008 [Zymoseptoria brevis]